MKSKKLKALAVLAVVGPLALAGCSQQAKSPEGGGGEGGKTQMTMWTHSAGNEGEMKVIAQMIEDFNGSQENYEVVRQDFPQAAYNDSVQGAAASGDLPCILDVDGPIMPNWAWNGWLVPSGLTDADVENFLPSTVGRYDGQIYSVGYWDATTLIFTRSSILEKVGARVPTVEQPWTAEEFADIQKKLKDTGDYEYVIDWGPGWADEWWPYAYAPLMQSFGGDLIDRQTMTHADGVLNGTEAVAFGKWFQSLYTKGYANKKPADDKSFVLGRVPLDYMGNWAYAEAKEKWGDDLIVLPPPDFGKGSKIGAASWQYGISSTCATPEGAAAFINYMLEPKQIAANSAATKLIPITQAGADISPDYKPGGPLRFYYEFSKKFALVRPGTPGYPFLTSTYEKAMRAIVNGADVQRTLDDAADAIDRNIKDNKGYGFKL